MLRLPTLDRVTGMRHTLAAALLIGMAALPSCTAAPPSVDEEQVEEWTDGMAASEAGRTDLVGGVSGALSDPADPASPSLGYSDPTSIDGFEAACIDHGAIEVSWRIAADGTTATGSAEVVCTGQSERIALGFTVEDVQTVGVVATTAAGDPIAFRVSITGSSGPQPDADEG